MQVRRRRTAIALCDRMARWSWLVFALALSTTAPARELLPAGKDLPGASFAVAEPPSELLLSDDATFAHFAAPVRADVDELLQRYDIQDHATLREALSARRDLQLLAGENQAALDTTLQIRALEDKPDIRLWSGLWAEALLKSRLAPAGDTTDALKAFDQQYRALLAPLPWEQVQAQAADSDQFFSVVSPAIGRSLAQSQLDPAAAANHALSRELAWTLLRFRQIVTVQVPIAATAHAALADYIGSHQASAPDIWPAREVDLQGHDALTPVTVAIWDSGTDPAVFGQQLYTDPKAASTNTHGLAFDLQLRPAQGELMPLSPAQRADYPQWLKLMQGFSDLRAHIPSPEAALLRQRMTTLPASDGGRFWESLGLYSHYVHGTHVAGIAARGNPAIRLAIARFNFDGDWLQVPTAPSEARSRQWAADMQQSVDWFRAHGVRVVNMSWGFKPDDYASDLERNGIGASAEARQQLARQFYGIERNALEAAIRSAPDILFICAAGNSNSDAGHDDTVPASLVLPNLLTVGAVDAAGRETSYTSYGDTVRVYADGDQIDSVIPGGQHLRLSGTSMASPQVTNLAAKLLAIEPALTPQQLIQRIVDTSTASDDGRLHLIDPKAAIAY